MGTDLGLPLRVDREIGEQLAAGHFARDRRGESSVLASFWTWDYPEPLDGHVHAGMEVGMVLTGEVEMSLGGERFACGPGEVWLCGMWEPHAWRIRYGGTTNISLIFLPELLAEQVEGAPPYYRLFAISSDRRPRVSDPKVRRFLLSIGNDVHRYIEEQGPFWQTAVRLSLLRILVELSRVCGPAVLSEEQAAASATGVSLARIMPAVRLAHERPWSRIAAADAAAACALSQSRFQHVFREAMGVSFGKFCLRIRLALVAHLLLYSDRTVAAIAAETGFVDASHVCRTFVKHYACTPNQYRQRTEQDRPGQR